MAALNFPASPSVDDLYTANGSTWKWDGTSWNVVPANVLLANLGDVSVGGVTDGQALVYNATSGDWEAGQAGGNTTTEGLYEMANTISVDYTITSGNNAMSAGPITVDSGVTVTVPSGSVWTIV
jgi:hypothetical protein